MLLIVEPLNNGHIGIIHLSYIERLSSLWRLKLIYSLFCRSSILLELKEPSLALQAVEAGLNMNSSSFELHMNRATALKDMGEKEKAKEAFQKTVELNPDYLPAVNKLALMYSSDSQHELALPL